MMGGRTPAYVQALHDNYGDIVRIGPNELSIRDYSAIDKVLGYNGKMDKGMCLCPSLVPKFKPMRAFAAYKGPWYLGSFAKKAQSVHAIRDVHGHAQRRKYWDRGFSGKALAEYQAQIKERTEQFIQALRKASERGPVTISDWCTFVAFDISKAVVIAAEEQSC